MKIYIYADGKLAQIRKADTPDEFYGVPLEGTTVGISFDEVTNGGLVEDILSHWDAYSIQNGTLQKNGVGITPNLPGEAATLDARIKVGYPGLPDWARTATPEDAATYIRGQIWGGADRAAVNAYLDSMIQPVTGTTLATALTSLNTQISHLKLVLGMVGDAVISTREMLILIAQILIYIRDVLRRITTYFKGTL